MQRILLTSLVCTGLIAQVEAAEHRLAFSKASALEVFVEHADNQPWCGKDLQLRFQGEGAATATPVVSIMPKLGVLLGRECASAESVRWHSVDGSGKTLASGSASAQQRWQLQIAEGYGVSADSAPASSHTASANTASANTASTEPASTQPAPLTAAAPATTAAPNQPQASTQAAAPGQTDTPVSSAAAAAEQDTATSASVPQAVTVAPAVPAKPSQPAATETATLTATAPDAATRANNAAAADNSAAANNQASTSAPAAAEPSRFAVNDWTPRSSRETLQQAQFATPLRDQNGCLFNTNFRFDVAAEFISSNSEGLSCDPEGRVQGKGRFTITRSDGRKLGSIQADFLHGQAFSNGSPVFEIQHLDAERLFALVGSDPARKIHYLVEVNSRNGVWNLANFTLLALTANEDLFRNAAQIEQVVQQGTALLQPLIDSRSYNLTFIALSSLDRRISGNGFNDDSRLYQMTLNRSRNKTQWTYNLQRATNHLFQRDQRLALQAKREQERLEREQRLAAQREQQQRRMQLQRQAYTEQSNLSRYQSLTQQTPQELRQRWVRELDYQPFVRSDYTRLLAGTPASWRQVVHVRGMEGPSCKVDAPYPALLDCSEKLDTGWYRVNGEIRLSTEQVDDEGLPLTLIAAQQLSACADQQCLEQFKPLALMQAELNDPQWDPVAAQALVDRVNRGEFE